MGERASQTKKVKLGVLDQSNKLERLYQKENNLANLKMGTLQPWEPLLVLHLSQVS